MRMETERDHAPEAMLGAGEGDAAFDAWTLEELGDELGSLRAPVTGSDDPGA
jgi:hypothetical protein